MSKPTTLRKALAVILVLTVGSFYTLVTTTAMAQTAPKASGELSITGPVTLNGTAAISGATVFSDSTLKTGRNGGATVNLGKFGRVELGPETEMTLRFAEGTVGGNLRAGRAVVNAPAGVGISVVTADGIAVSDGKQAAALTVDVTCGNTRVMASRSDAKVTAGNKVEYVAAGQEVQVGTQTAGATSRCTRLSAAGAGAGMGGLSSGAIAALIIAGVGGAVAGAVAASQSDEVSASQIVVSGFKP